MKAKYDGTCPYCGDRIVAGKDEIASGRKGWGHPDCVGDDKPTRHSEYNPVMKDSVKRGKYDGWYCARCGKHYLSRTEANTCCFYAKLEDKGDEWDFICEDCGSIYKVKILADVKDWERDCPDCGSKHVKVK